MRLLSTGRNRYPTCLGRRHHYRHTYRVTHDTTEIKILIKIQDEGPWTIISLPRYQLQCRNHTTLKLF